MASSSSSSSSSNSPCAACKFLRRKCMPGCIFAPYFPPEEPQKFANVHKIFGASNVTKLLNELLPHQREDAVNSLAYEAEARMKDPVYGCVGAISVLQRQVHRLQKELDAANADLIRYACNDVVIPAAASSSALLTPPPPHHNMNTAAAAAAPHHHLLRQRSFEFRRRGPGSTSSTSATAAAGSSNFYPAPAHLQLPYNAGPSPNWSNINNPSGGGTGGTGDNNM